MSQVGSRTPAGRVGTLVKIFGQARLERWRRVLRRSASRVPVVREIVERIVLWDATEQPQVVASEIVWRSTHGPRRHALKLAEPRRNPTAPWATSSSGDAIRWALVDAPGLGEYLRSEPFVQHLSLAETHDRVRSRGVDVVAIDLGEWASTPARELLEEAREVGIACLVWCGAKGRQDRSVPSLPDGVPVFAEMGGRLDGNGEGCSLISLGPSEVPRLPRGEMFAERTGLDESDDLPPEVREKLRHRARSWTLRGLPEPTLALLEPGGDHRRAVRMMLEGAILCTPVSGDPIPFLEGAPRIKVNSLSELSLWIDEHRDIDLAALAHASARFARRTLTFPAGHRRLRFHTGLPGSPSREPGVTVICVSRRIAMLPDVLRTFRSFDYPNSRLICVVNQDEVSARALEDLLALAPDVDFLRTTSAMSLGESLNRARSLVDTELWTKMDDDDHYGPRYLRDAVEALTLSGADVVGKGTYFVFSHPSRALFLRDETSPWTPSDRFVHGGTILARTEMTRDILFQPVVRGTDSLFLQECKLRGLSIYSSDPFNFAYVRYAEPGHHTFDVSTESVLARASRVLQECHASAVDC